MALYSTFCPVINNISILISNLWKKFPFFDQLFDRRRRGVRFREVLPDPNGFAMQILVEQCSCARVGFPE